MKRLLVLQSVYLVMAAGYNAVSFVLLQSTGTGLAQTSPTYGLLMVLIIVGPCVVFGCLGYTQIHAVYALFVALVFCFIGGTLPHLRAYISGDLSNYLSVGSLIAAAVINFSGSIIFLLSAREAWRLQQATWSQNI